MDPVIFVPALVVGEPPRACCHVQCSDVRILCSISGNGENPAFSSAPALVYIETQVDPLFGFAFLQTFIDILQEYFGTLSAATLKDHFDVVYQVRFQT